MHKTKQSMREVKAGVWLTLGIGLALTLSACSTMDAKECRAANWGHLGYSDASKGAERSVASDRANDCSEHGIRMDTTAYQQGWNEGLKEFCTAASGQSFGDRGRSYKPGYCPPGPESAFLATYMPAYKNYQHRQRIDSLQRDINNKNDEIIRLQAKKDSNNDAKISRLRGEVNVLYSRLNSERMMQSRER